jgi:subtilase family serine protease
MAQPQSAPIPGVGGAPVTVRGLPDIAMDADANTGADVYVSGSATVIGGTSLSSPLSMGVYARLQSAHGNRLGFGPIAFYKIYSENPNATQTPAGPPPTELVGGFHDVLTGSNGLYTALPRYDYTTGLGSFDIQAVNAAIGR